MDSVIFDLDGTLWDSTLNVTRAWNKILKNLQEREVTEEEIRSLSGLHFHEIGKKLFPVLSKERLQHLLHVCGQEECRLLTEEGGELYEPLEHVLQALAQKYKLFIVSNCQAGYIEAFFAYHKVGKYFVDYENPGRTGLSKGKNIKLVIERNKLQSPVYVGDTEGDGQAAEYAGIPFIYASYGFGEAKKYDHAIERLDQLLDIF